MKFINSSNWPYILSTLAIIILAVVQFFVIKYAYTLKYNEVESNYRNVYEYAQPNMRVQWEELDSLTSIYLDKNELISAGQISISYLTSLKEVILNIEQLDRNFQSYFRKVGLVDEVNYHITLGELTIKSFNAKIVNTSLPFSIIGNIQSNEKLVYRHLIQSDYLQGELNLYINFPNQTYYLFKEMKWVFLFSIITFVMVAFISFYNLKNWMYQKRSSEIKEDLINNISHEFKTPLTSIALASSSIQNNQHELSQERVLELNAIISRQNERLQKLVDSLLTTAFLDQKYQVTLIPTNVNDYLEKLLQRYLLDDIESTSAINFEKGTLKKKAQIDSFLFETIITNILDNAFKYCENIPKISIKTVEQQNDILIQISDNGPGIPSGEENAIFEKFSRFNSAGKPGLGLGLFQVKKLIKTHFGQIWAKNDKIGTTFYIKIPSIK